MLSEARIHLTPTVLRGVITSTEIVLPELTHRQGTRTLFSPTVKRLKLNFLPHAVF